MEEQNYFLSAGLPVKKKGVSWRSTMGETQIKICFFRFPRDLERCKKWIINTQRADLMNKHPDYLYKNCRLCSNHFKMVTFINDLNNHLKTDALPTLFDIPNPPQPLIFKQKPPKKRNLEYSRTNTKCQKAVLMDANETATERKLTEWQHAAKRFHLTSPVGGSVCYQRNGVLARKQQRVDGARI